MCAARRFRPKGMIKVPSLPIARHENDKLSNCVQRGLYLGDVTALCPLPHSSTLPQDSATGGKSVLHDNDRQHDTILAGIGGGVYWYDPYRNGQDALLLVSAVFEAGRIHGIVPAPDFDKSCPAIHFNISHEIQEYCHTRALLIWGERRVILVAVQHDNMDTLKGRLMNRVAMLPLLIHWVHDVIPLPHDTLQLEHPTVAVGLADNSVEQWIMPTRVSDKVGVTIEPQCIRRIECAMRSVLYSLALYGPSIEMLKVASGTIFNQIQLWSPNDAPAFGVHIENNAGGRPKPWAVLSGHEGSILRVRWGSDGGNVFSTSDDRTARVWYVPSRHHQDPALDRTAGNFTSSAKNMAVGITLCGHSSRVWDVHVTTLKNKTLLVTAGEDCTVRLWLAPQILSSAKMCRDNYDQTDSMIDMNFDEPSAILRGHRGRGVWRAMTMDSPSGNKILVTAGADASIKLWDIQQLISSKPERSENISEEYVSHHQAEESVNMFLEPSSAHTCSDKYSADPASTLYAEHQSWVDATRFQTSQHTDTKKDYLCNSKDEYIRIICLSNHLTLYVATNRGCVYRVDVKKDAKNLWHWQEIHRVNPCGPVVGLIRVAYFGETAASLHHHNLVLGDIHGMISTLKISSSFRNDDKTVSHGASEFATEVQQSWQACEPRRLLDVFSGTGNIGREMDHLFTSEVGGIVKCWKRKHISSVLSDKTEYQAIWSMLGVAQMPFKQRVSALSYHQENRLLLCGDQSGNIAVFDVTGLRTSALFNNATINSPYGLLAASRRAHEKNAITFAAIRNVSKNLHKFIIEPEHQTAVEFITGGRDGYLCTFALRAVTQSGLKPDDEHTNDADDQTILTTMTSSNTELSCSQRWHAESCKHLCGNAHLCFCPSLRARESMFKTRVSFAPCHLLCLTKQRVPGISTVHALSWGNDPALHDGKKWPSRTSKADPIHLIAGFRETEFIAIDMLSHRELLRVQCGGWHRPLSLLVNEQNIAEISFAFCKGGELTLLHSLPKIACKENYDDEWNLCELNGWSHGREIHAVRILPPPVVHSEHFGLLTGSEDGSIICHHHTRSLSGQMMHRHEEIGMHIGGTAVRAIALFPECSGGGLCDITQDARSYILLSAGAKEVIMAWRIEWIRTDGFDASSGEASYNDMWEIRTTCLGAREQTKESKKSNQRCMAVVGFMPFKLGSHYYAFHSVALTAMSDGSLKVLALHSDRGCGNFDACFRLVSVMNHHSHPLLSVAVLAVPLGNTTTSASNAVVLACSGATDGKIAVWDLTSVVVSLSMQQSHSSGDLRSFHNTVKPVTSLPYAHQSGVNSIAMTTSTNASPGRFLIASGGDDQVIRVTLLSINQKTSKERRKSNPVSVDVLKTINTDYAHGSSIKGVWMHSSGLVATTSHDQRLRVWKVRDTAGHDLAIAAVAGSLVECPEPENLDACYIGGDVHLLHVAVSGRGLQMFHVDLDGL